MSMMVTHVDGNLFDITFHNRNSKSHLCRGPKYHTKIHYELNKNLRSLVLQYGLEYIVHTGVLKHWFKNLIETSVFTLAEATTSGSVLLICLESYPQLACLFSQ